MFCLCDSLRWNLCKNKKVVNVIHAPKFAEAPVISGHTYAEVETVIEGDTANLHCLASGQPIPTLRWEKASDN